MININKFRIIDISPEVSAETAVYPGDTRFSRNVSFDIKNGDHLTLSDMTSTLHIGAHADAPNHYHLEGAGIGERDLDYYIGPCQIIELKLSTQSSAQIQDLKGVEIKAPRVLFKTSSFLNTKVWSKEFNSLSHELIEYLAAKGVRLIGIDTPSIDPEDSKNLSAHKAVYKNDMAILEGLILENVSPGLYFLLAQPLKIKNADASPVRAVLLI